MVWLISALCVFFSIFLLSLGDVLLFGLLFGGEGGVEYRDLQRPLDRSVDKTLGKMDTLKASELRESDGLVKMTLKRFILEWLVFFFMIHCI